MTDRYFPRYGPGLNLGLVVVLLLLLIPLGCKPKEPPLSPGAQALKKGVAEELAKLGPPLVGPVAKGSTAEINVTLQKIFLDCKDDVSFCPYKVVVGDKNGITVGRYPVEKGFGLDFSNYTMIRKVLQGRRITQERLYMQDGSRLYAICAPLLQGDELMGILAFIFQAEEVSKKWGVSEQEFLALDFNK